MSSGDGVFVKLAFGIITFAQCFHVRQCGRIIPARAGPLWWVGAATTEHTRLKSEIISQKNFILQFLVLTAKGQP